MNSARKDRATKNGFATLEGAAAHLLRYFAPVLLLVAFSDGLAAESSPGPSRTQESQGVDQVRPEIERAVQTAQELVKQNKFKEVFAALGKTDALANKTPYETYVLAKARGAAAAAAGDMQAAVPAYEVVIGSGRASQPETIGLLQTMAEIYHRNKDYAKAINALTRYFAAGGSDPKMRSLLSQSYYATKDFTSAVTALHGEIEADEKLKKTPPEERLRLLAECYAQLDNNTGWLWTLERLVSYYPKKEYWGELLARVRRNPGIGDRLLLDVYRLHAATGTVNSAAGYVEMARLALDGGFPGEAKSTLDQGFLAGVLGSGPDAQRQTELRERATRQAAEEVAKLPQYEAQAVASRDKEALARVGYAYVTHGQYAKGLALLEQGLRMTGFERQGDARLHFGIALVLAGQKAKAIDIFRTVRGVHGSADLAKLWILYLRQPAA